MGAQPPRTGSASHLNTLDAGEGSNSSVATPAAAQQPPEFWMEALAAMAAQLQHRPRRNLIPASTFGITEEELQRRRDHHLCFRCGEAGHPAWRCNQRQANQAN